MRLLPKHVLLGELRRRAAPLLRSLGLAARPRGPERALSALLEVLRAVARRPVRAHRSAAARGVCLQVPRGDAAPLPAEAPVRPPPAPAAAAKAHGHERHLARALGAGLRPGREFREGALPSHRDRWRHLLGRVPLLERGRVLHVRGARLAPRLPRQRRGLHASLIQMLPFRSGPSLGSVFRGSVGKVGLSGAADLHPKVCHAAVDNDRDVPVPSIE
mmetsp:Transcript_4773/g.11600  ORF Transcript_4773/g.11600 Transcript_4773/m.11600 type:complete len:217 (-) Transcript_4773:548-1198(-)